jgi:subtilisin family serine protease
VNVLSVWKKDENYGAGVKVMIISDGLDTSHPDLRDNYVSGKRSLWVPILKGNVYYISLDCKITKEYLVFLAARLRSSFGVSAVGDTGAFFLLYQQLESSTFCCNILRNDDA